MSRKKAEIDASLTLLCIIIASERCHLREGQECGISVEKERSDGRWNGEGYPEFRNRGTHSDGMKTHLQPCQEMPS